MGKYNRTSTTIQDAIDYHYVKRVRRALLQQTVRKIDRLAQKAGCAETLNHCKT